MCWLLSAIASLVAVPGPRHSTGSAVVKGGLHCSVTRKIFLDQDQTAVAGGLLAAYHCEVLSTSVNRVNETLPREGPGEC